MWVERTPPMSAATAETVSSSAYQARSIGSCGQGERGRRQVEELLGVGLGAAASAFGSVGEVSRRGGNSCRPARKVSSRADRSAVEEPPVGGGQQGGEHPERVGARARPRRSGGTRWTRPAPRWRRRRAGRRSRSGASPSRRRSGRPAPVRCGVPTRIAPCRSAVTRSRLPSRSASGAQLGGHVGVHLCATSSSVVYAGTSRPYRSERMTAKRARNSVGVTVQSLFVGIAQHQRHILRPTVQQC